MKRVALQLEHRYKNRLVGTHLIEAGSGLTTIGSSESAHVHLLGEEISGLHAAIERSQDNWVLADLGSEAGTWINKKPIVEEPITGATVIHIGSHQLKVTPHALERDLFNNADTSQGEGEWFHQVIVLKNGLVERSVLLAPKEQFHLSYAGFDKVLPAPADGNWTEERFGDVTVKRRLTRSSAVKQSTREAFQTSFEPSVHGPILSLLAIFLLVFVGLILAPRGNNELKSINPSMQNQYTRMIYDGKRARAKKEQYQKYHKQMRGQTAAGSAQPTAGGDAGAIKAGGAKTTGARVINNLKAAGLGALIGKISKRASKSAILLQAAGTSADSKTSGRALGVGGGGQLDKIGTGATSGGALASKVAGVGTLGKGGGSSAYKGSGALAHGTVGTADVGVIEEESEVEGGLDKETIARVINSQLGQIRYCYERQLSANPDLYGKILVKFTIGASGAVVTQNVGNSSLNNAMVEGCILRRIAGWQFPQPKGGTNVIVTYPFLFKSTR